MKLFIVESPGKIKKIQAFLGSDYKVMASVGHIRDLPVKGMGVEPPQFIPEYIVTKPDVVKKLKEAVKGVMAVYLATDPDREGEAIAWHLAQTLKLKEPRRVTYTEITEKAVKDALLKPRDIDQNLVSAQEGRRVLDRQVGYMVSPALSAQGGGSLSAGRVQSPAVRLVVERERAIRDFKVTNHFGVELLFPPGSDSIAAWKALWLPKQGWLEEGQEYILDEATAKKVAAVKPVTVRECKNSKSNSAPPAPFTTSTLQQAASAALKINPKTCMELAQKLYEGGHITYMRTDSPNLSNEAIAAIRAWARRTGLELPSQPRTWKSKEGAQEAHEAIRPTHVETETAGETDQEKALYALIRLRAIASQLADAVYAVRTLTLVGDADGREAVFEAKGKTLEVSGWRALVAKDQTEEDDEEAENAVPELGAGTSLTEYEGKVAAKKTKPPARYTEASLVRELEKRGIGRPSTYASILDSIIKRHKYIEIEKRQLKPTARGEQIIDALVGRFKFLDYEFTKNMESQLDEVAEGKSKYLPLVAGNHKTLTEEIQKFVMETAHPCPDCGKPLVHKLREATKDHKGYNFWGCSGYPDCKSTFEDDGGKPGNKQEKPKMELSEHKCGQCGKPLVHRVREASGDNKGYNFWGCSGYPGCKATYVDDGGKPGELQSAKRPEPSGFKCKECGSDLIRRKGISKKTDKPYDFFACMNKDCDTTYFTKDDKPDFEGKKK